MRLTDTHLKFMELLPVIAHAKAKGGGYDWPMGVTQKMVIALRDAGLVKVTVHADRYGMDYMRVSSSEPKAPAKAPALGSSPLKR